MSEQAYTILIYKNEYEFIEEKDELEEMYMYLHWDICTLEEEIEELDIAIAASPGYGYFVIVDQALRVVYERRLL